MDRMLTDAGSPFPPPAPPPRDLAWHLANVPHAAVAHAGFWRRFLANAVDAVILLVANEFLARITGAIWEVPTDGFTAAIRLLVDLLLSVGVGVLLYWLYFAGMESSSRRATIGKRLLGIAVTDLTGRRISFGRATARHFAEYLSVLTLGIGYVIQPFTARRQALHDLIAGTLVVHADSVDFAAPSAPPLVGAGSANAAAPTRPRGGRFPRWALALILGVLALGGGVAALGYFVVVPWLRDTQTAVSDEIADVIAAQVSAKIERAACGNRVALREYDLDVNNATVPGEVGVRTGTDGTVIYGFVTTIDRSGIALGAGAGQAYSAVPVVRGGLIELAEPSATSDLFRPFLSAEGFADGIAAGINRALAEHGLRATAVTLHRGSLTIETEPAGGVGRRTALTARG